VKTLTPLSLAGLVPVALAGMLLAACGSTSAPSSGGGGGGGGSQPTSGNSGSTSGSSTSVNDGIGHAVNVCSLLPATTAASVSGEPVTVANEQDTLSYKIYTCNYTTADGTNGFDINVLALDAAAGYAADIQTHQTTGSPVTPVSGLGDKAFSTSDGVEALFGNYSIDVSNLTGNSTACETLIRDLQQKI
jgi:hypothetical protein